MKRLKNYLLVALFAFSTITSFVYASDEFTIGENTFMITDEGYHKCELTEYSGEVENLVIPSTVNFNNQNYSIVGIGFDAFNLNASLVTVELPATIDYIGPSAFSDCYSLTSINLQKVTIIGDDAFSNDKSLKGVMFGQKLTSIGARAFMNCVELKTIKTPHLASSIMNGAFSGCEKLEEVILGAGMHIIGDTAFARCTALQHISCHAATPPQISENTFDREVTQNILLYIPAGTKDAYIESLWGEFFAFENIIEKGNAPVAAPTTPVATTSDAPPAPKKRPGELKVSQKGNVARVVLPDGASIEVYDTDDVLLETIKMIDGNLYNE